MNKTYLLLDLNNYFFRAKHVAPKKIIPYSYVDKESDEELMKQRAGMTIHIVLTSILKAWKLFNANHIVVCTEGRSWRKDVNKAYKHNRQEAKEKFTEFEQKEFEIFFAAINDFIKFLNSRSNCTILNHANLEADDLIAGWIQNHKNDKHIICSSDSDFRQLIADNVSIYDGVGKRIFTASAILDDDNKILNCKKTGKPLEAVEPEWYLFLKCIRGDSTDHVFPAYPGAREKSSKTKVGIKDAFLDRFNKGYDWNNFMGQHWEDVDGNKIKVLDAYKENLMLIGLDQQPENIRKIIDSVCSNLEPKKNLTIGAYFLKFCEKYGLEDIKTRPDNYVNMIASPLPKD